MIDKQKGYVLIEILLGLALTGILAAGIATFTIQTFTESSKSNSRMQALMQAQNVGHWLSRDVQMSSNITLGESAGFPINLLWVDIDQNEYQASYTIADGEIKRNLTKNDEEPVQMLIAQDINTAPELTSCNYTDGGLFTLNVTATHGNNDVSETYIIKKRLDLQ